MNFLQSGHIVKKLMREKPKKETNPYSNVFEIISCVSAGEVSRLTHVFFKSMVVRVSVNSYFFLSQRNYRHFFWILVT